MAGRRSKPADYDVALPMDVPDQGGVEKAKRRYVKPKAYGKCPKCLAEKVAVVQQGTHWAWKSHKYRTWSGASLECQASAVRICDLAEGRPNLAPEPVACPCGGRADA